jgi:hypothetical protein
VLSSLENMRAQGRTDLRASLQILRGQEAGFFVLPENCECTGGLPFCVGPLVLSL